MTVNKERVRLLVDELRTTKVRKINCTLRDGPDRACATWVAWGLIPEQDRPKPDPDNPDNTQYIYRAVAEWLGLHPSTLWTINDLQLGEGDFTRVANGLERRYL
jgi:hypothetical protein